MTSLYDYDVYMESPNATEMAQAASAEVEGADTIDTVNMTVTSDQVLLNGASPQDKIYFDTLSVESLNISNDDIFTFDNSVMSVALPPPAAPPPAPMDLTHLYVVGGVVGVLALGGLIMAAFHKYGKSRRSTIPEATQFLVDDDNENMSYSINPIHNSIGV